MSDDTPEMMPDMTAAELALSLLDGDARADAMRRLLSDRAFAADLELWRDHLAQLFDLWPEAAAPHGVLERIEHDLDGTGPSFVTPIPTPRRWLWPSATGLASIAAAALLFVVVSRPAPAPLAPSHPAPVAQASVPATMLVAAIAPTDKGIPVTAIYDPASGGMRLTAMQLADAGHSAELWVIAGDGVPHSLGLMHGEGTRMAVDAANRARMAAGATLAVSIEPVGGSPTGLPTGPVVAKGALAEV